MTHGVGIDCAQAIPGLLELGDLDDIAGLVAPRPLLLCSADEDKYSRDAPHIAEAAACAYRNAGAPEALQHYRARGGHALTEERFDAIVDWVIAQLSENQNTARSQPLRVWPVGFDQRYGRLLTGSAPRCMRRWPCFEIAAREPAT
jgi:hypothetical protein